MGNDVIGRVHTVVKVEWQPKIASNFKFEWRLDGEVIDKVKDDEEADNIDEF